MGKGRKGGGRNESGKLTGEVVEKLPALPDLRVVEPEDEMTGTEL